MAATLSALFQRSSIDDPEDVLKSCNDALRNKQDCNILHAKVVALLKLDRFDDALRTLEEAGNALKKEAAFERAYALYKTGQLDKAIEIAKELSTQHRGAQHVEAQSSYRAEDFSHASELYERLLADEAASAREAGDLRVNCTAVNAQLQFAAPGGLVSSRNPTRSDLEAFETTYNVATAAIGKGELAKAALLLRRAEELCRSSDELTEDDKEAELLPIHVQQLYVAAQTGNAQETERLVKEIDVKKISESSTKQIGINNLLLSSSSSMSPYLLYKAFHETPVPVDADRLFSFQQRTSAVNSAVIDLSVHKYEGVVQSTSKRLTKQTAPITSADINVLSPLNVAAHIQRQQATNAESTKTLRQEATALLKQRSNDLGLLLTVVQLNIDESRPANALTLFKSFLDTLDASISESDQDVRHSPSLIAIHVALCKLLGHTLQAQTELEKAARFWLARRQQAPASLLRAAGAALAEHPRSHADLNLAGDLFAHLRQQDQADKFALAGSVAVRALSVPEEASADARQLTAVSELIADIDVSALEAAGVATVSAATTVTKPGVKRTAVDVEEKQAAPTHAVGQAKKRRRLQKSRMPKDFDPERKLDPERWLPLRDRASYRPPKGRKGKARAERTQGGVVAEDGASVVVQASTVVSAQKSAGGGGKKKKGKGRR